MAPLSPPGPSLDATTIAAVIALTKVITVGRGGDSILIKVGAAKIEITPRGDIEIKGRGDIDINSTGDIAIKAYRATAITNGTGASITLSGPTIDINHGALEVI